MATSDWLPESSDWQAWSVPAFPPALTAGVQAVESMTQAVTAMLDAARVSLEAFSAIQLDRVDLTQTAVKAALLALDAALKSLEGGTGIYLLLVPPRRRVVVPQVVQAALSAVGLPGVPPGKVDLGVLQLELQAASAGLDPKVKQLLTQARSATAGSAGFLRTVVESLNDRGDASRPQLLTTDAVAGNVIISGAPDYLSLLSFLAAMDSLVSPGRPAAALNAPDIPTPQDLKAQRLAVGVQLSWRPRPAVVQIPALNANLTLPEVAVIRSTDPKFLRARTPSDLFGTSRLTEGQTAGSSGATKVIKIRNNLSTLSSYLDDAVTKSTEPVFYALSYHLKDLDENDLGFGPLSNVVKVIPGVSPSSSRTGAATPPDWIRSPRALDLIPSLASAFDALRSAGTTLGGSTLSASTSLKAYTTFLKELSDRFTKLVDTASTAVSQVSALAGQDIKAGAGIYAFSGSGGNGFLLKSVATAVSQLAFSDTHFVGGAVVLVAGPSPEVVRPVWDVLQLLLGTAGAEESPAAAALRSLNDALVTVAAQTIGAEEAPAASSSALEGCPPAAPAVPALSDDFTA